MNILSGELCLEAKQTKMYICTLENFILIAFRVVCTRSGDEDECMVEITSIYIIL